MADPWPAPIPVPAPQPVIAGHGITYADPQSRKGTGYGLIVLVDEAASGFTVKDFVPSASMKWAEEGYCVVEITSKAFEDKSQDPLATAIKQLDSSAKIESKGTYGLVCYSPTAWNLAAPFLEAHKGQIVGAVLYNDVASQNKLGAIPIPTLQHLAGKLEQRIPTTSQLQIYDYAEQPHHSFATPHQTRFHYATEAVSHTRNLTFLKKRMNGPYFDLEDLWDEHTFYEFGNRSVENCMNTMVKEPYVNHIPTMTGGIGRKDLTAFYTNHFIFSNPKDAELELISRTVGIDRVVDEFVYKTTHDQPIDWLIPGVPPTNVKLEVPMLAIVNIRGDRLYHEHIHWDQSTILKQIGSLPEYLPHKAKETATNGVNGTKVNGHRNVEFRTPVGGTEIVDKLRDKGCVPSNEMFEYKVREV